MHKLFFPHEIHFSSKCLINLPDAKSTFYKRYMKRLMYPIFRHFASVVFFISVP